MDSLGSLVEVGALRGAFGFRGWIRVVPLGDGGVLDTCRDWQLCRPGQPPVALELEGVKRHGAIWVAKWRGCETKEDADAIRGTIAVPRSSFPELPEGHYYWVDLIGCSVVNREGVVLGTVVGLGSNGAQDLLRVERAKGPETLIPMVSAYLDRVDIAVRTISVDWSADW